MIPSVVILCGGSAAEHEVSLRSGNAVYEALKSQDISCRLVEISNTTPSDLVPTRDILFLTNHGTFGEDGQLQKLLDEKGFIYTGSDATASALCFDKVLAKHLVNRLDIAIAEGVVFAENLDADSLYATLGPKVVLKPQAQGSSVGLHVVSSLQDLYAALKCVHNTPPHVPYLAERYIEGKEITCGYLNGQTLVPVEIITDAGHYDYRAKYTPGHSSYACPANVSPSQLAHIVQTTQRICHAAGIRDFARVDFRLGAGSVLYFLEINTLPGMTTTSLLPMSAAPLGYDFPSLCRAMLRGAHARFADKYAMKLAEV